MTAFLVAVMATALVREVPHEYLGVAIFVLVGAHIASHGYWFKALRRGRYDALRILDLVVVAGLLLTLLGMVASSLVISRHAFGFLPAIPGSAWSRRAHMLCSYWSFVLAFVHVGLQMRRAIRMLRLPKREHVSTLVRVVLAAVVLYGCISFMRLGLPSYLLGQVQFAAADYGMPLVLTLARHASVAALVACLSHCVACALGSHGDRIKDESARQP